jgi:hypothetical protein
MFEQMFHLCGAGCGMLMHVPIGLERVLVAVAESISCQCRRRHKSENDESRRVVVVVFVALFAPVGSLAADDFIIFRSLLPFVFRLSEA